mgnify:CR=1 FL=1
MENSLFDNPKSKPKHKKSKRETRRILSVSKGSEYSLTNIENISYEGIKTDLSSSFSDDFDDSDKRGG